MGVSAQLYLSLALWGAAAFVMTVSALDDQDGYVTRKRGTRQAQSAKSCQFPFIYTGVTHTTCTTVGDPEGKLWCSTKTDSQNNHVPGGNFKHCTSADIAPPAKSCQFPFIFNGVTHTTCTTVEDPEGKLWCSTKTDNQNNHVPGGNFKHCTSADQGNSGTASGGGSNTATGNCNCQPMVVCASEIDKNPKDCRLSDGSNGFCCPPDNPSTSSTSQRVLVESRIQEPAPSLNRQQIDAASQKGNEMITRRKQIEDQMIREGNVLKRNSPASSHARFFKISPQTRKISEDARAVLETSKSLIIDNQLSDRAGAHGLRAVTLRNTIMEGRCPTPIGCSRSKYRTTDGSCNNLQNTWWGQTNMPFQRVAVPTYDDGVSKARTRAVDKSELPNVREIVNNALVESDFDDPKYTLSLMQWGQFIDHDIAHTPFPRMPSGEGIECCNPNSVKHPDCFEITIPSSDGFFAPRQQTCMNFVRSMLSLNPQCSMGFAEQMNTLTAFLDGSNIYGSSKEEQDSVRSFNGGMLKTSGNNLLPIDRERGCQAQLRNADCYVAGDSRVNEQPGLAAMHLIWMREHNRVVRELQKITSGWTDEEMFQEARRIVVAEYQHIMYNEYFPITLGTNYMQSFGLSTRTSGFSNDYRPDINPTITNEFATAAFRYGHSLVQGIMDLYSANGAVSTIKLRDHWMSPHLLKQGRVDDIFRSWMQQPSQRFDSFITAEFTNHLFQQPGGNFGLDLMSLNIQRGRDHGIATYNDIRSLCGLRRASTFSDITDQIPKQFVERLQRVYRNVNDIDYFVGGLMEKPVPGSHLGHTFLCIVGDQFARLKKADRYFYDLNGQFSEGQLQEIRRASWARILCDNGDSVTNVQPLAFRLQDNNRNRPVDCNSAQIPKVNLNLWRTERPQSQG